MLAYRYSQLSIRRKHWKLSLSPVNQSERKGKIAPMASVHKEICLSLYLMYSRVPIIRNLIQRQSWFNGTFWLPISSGNIPEYQVSVTKQRHIVPDNSKRSWFIGKSANHRNQYPAILPILRLKTLIRRQKCQSWEPISGYPDTSAFPVFRHLSGPECAG